MQNARDIQNTEDSDRDGIDDSVIITLELPYPPTVNHYYGRRGAQTFIAARGKAYRAEVNILVGLRQGRSGPLTGPLEISILSRPPDKRKRDLDNLLKSLLDAIQNCGSVFKDDNQLAKITIERGQPVKGGQVFVQVTAYQPPG